MGQLSARALVLAALLALAATSPAQAAGKPVGKARAAASHSKVDDTADEGGDDADETPDEVDRPVPTEAELKRQYRIVTADPSTVAFSAPVLPDLAQYTPAAMAKKIDRSRRGTVTVASLLNEPGFKSLTTAVDQGLSELALRQRGSLRAIFIEGGFVSLPELLASLPKDLFEQTGPGIFVLRLPLLVRHGATLEIGSGTKELRLSQERGAMLATEGTLYVSNSAIVGWSEAKNAPARFVDKHVFRPFIVGWGGSKTYIAGSRIANLGYASTKAFGLSLSQYSTTVAQRAVWPRPTGWILNTEISDLWYGFYSWEADDVVLRGNTLRDNIQYGIDPHDRSQRLIIAENEAFGTKRKHGIIISRDVDNSFIIGNKSHDNNLSGIVLDRQCSNTVIANNTTYRNKSDGIVLSESPDNVVWNNLSTGNLHHGIRLRNSTGIRIQDSSAIANGLAGIYGVSRDLTGTDRDFIEDPYTKAMSMVVAGGQLSGNGSGPVNLDEPTRAVLYGVDLRTPQRALGYRLGGVLLAFQIEVLDIVLNRKEVAVLEPIPPQKVAAQTAAPLPASIPLHR